MPVVDNVGLGKLPDHRETLLVDAVGPYPDRMRTCQSDCHDSEAVESSPGRLGRPNAELCAIVPDNAVDALVPIAVSSCAGVLGARFGVLPDAPDDAITAPTATAPATSTGTAHTTRRRNRLRMVTVSDR